MTRVCGKQIVTSDGKDVVTMKSGRTYRMHRCILRAGHLFSCGYIGPIE